MNQFIGVFLIFWLFQPLPVYSQAASDAQARHYQTAYEHILRSPEFKPYRAACVAVFDSLVAQDLVMFNQVLRKRWHYSVRQEGRLIDSLSAVDEANWHPPLYSPLTAGLTAATGAKKDCTVVLFSPLNNNMLVAEVSINQQGGPRLRDILSMFNQTLRYLLFFGPDGKVEHYYTQIINYN